MAPEIAEIATIVTSILTVVVSLQRKAISNYFRKADAFEEDSGVSFETKSDLRICILRKMLKSGEVVQFESVYYLNESRIEELKKRRRKRALILVPVILTIILAIIWAGAPK